MDDQDREVYEEQSLQLRADLKQWEGDWAVAHAGKKPGRDDIKQNPVIAQKYKQYNKLRDILAGKIPPPPAGPVEATRGHQQQNQQHQQQRKRTQSDAALPPQTPSKRSRPDQALQKTGMPAATRTPSAAHVGTPSSNRTSFTPLAAAPTSISPTPQRDGRVLGIFDLLGRTPSRPTATATKANIAATPSKQRTADLFPTATTTITTTITTPSTARFTATTPQSKRTTAQLLFQPSASATTPRRRRRGSRGSITDEEGGKENNTALFKTPSTNRVSKRRANNTTAQTPTSSTPSFLRRRTISMGTAAATGLARVDEQDEHGGVAGQRGAGEEDGDGDGDAEGEWGRVGPLRLPRKLGGLGRSLSSVVAGLRRMQDEAFEEEEDALREMEMEMEGGGGGGGAAGKGVGRKDVVEEVEVGDSQAPTQLGRDLPPKMTHQGHGDETAADAPAPLLSGFDEEALYDSLDEGKQRQPLRQFKKRGQKRSTRLVNMRPTRARRPAQTGGEADEEEEEEIDLVPETQFNAPKPTTTAGGDADDLRLSDFDSASEADFHASDFDEEDDEQAKTKTKTKAKAKKPKATAANDKKAKSGGEAKGEGIVKKAVRKVKATAHANFKRLKLRNSGSKGGPAHNSRFRRRR